MTNKGFIDKTGSEYKAKDTASIEHKERQYIQFPLRVVRSKAYREVNKDGSAGIRHITAVASSDSLDSYWEYFALNALQDMVTWAQVKKELKPLEGAVELRETHWETFAIGTIVDGWLFKNKEKGSIEFHIDIALKDGVWQADELWKDIVEGIVDKQLSVGGWIDWDVNDDAFEWEERDFIDEDGNEITIWVGKINNFILEHVAVTLLGWAANDDTRFLEAVVKSLGDTKYQEKMERFMEQRSKMVTKVNPSANEDSSSEGPVMKALHTITGLLKSRETTEEREVPSMPDKKKALKAAELLRDQLSGMAAGDIEDILREAGLPLGKASEETPAPAAVETDPEGTDTDTTEVKSETPPAAVEKTDDADVATPAVAKEEDKELDTEKTEEEIVPPVVKTETVNFEEAIEKAIKPIRDASTAAELRLQEAAEYFAEKEVETDLLVARIATLEEAHGVSKSTGTEVGDDILASTDTQGSPKTRKGTWVPF